MTGAGNFPWRVVFSLFDQLAVCLVYTFKTRLIPSPPALLVVPLLLTAPLFPTWHILGYQDLQTKWMNVLHLFKHLTFLRLIWNVICKYNLTMDACKHFWPKTYNLHHNPTNTYRYMCMCVCVCKQTFGQKCLPWVFFLRLFFFFWQFQVSKKNWQEGTGIFHMPSPHV